jgi:L-lactate dehydrogenase complex protein LldG
MSESRRQILEALRAARDPFPQAQTPSTYRPVIPREETDAAALLEQFTREAEKQAVVMHRVTDDGQALQTLATLLEGHSRIASWDPVEIALPGLPEMLREQRIDIADPQDDAPEVGLTGAMAGLAATGSLVLSSGAGTYRNTSLLPPVHVAVLRQDQILPDLESWFAGQREDAFGQMRRASNIVIVTGPSRTADIAMELVMGMHGPREMHIVLVEG